MLTPLEQISGRDDWRRDLAALDAQTVQRLTRSYQRTLDQLNPLVDNLIGAMGPNERMSREQFVEIREYQQLIQRIELEMNAFAGLLNDTMGEGQGEAVRIGANAARSMAVNSAPNVASQILAVWNQPDPQAIVNAANYLASDAMRQNLARFGAESADYVADMLLSGIAQGRNPYQTAELIRRTLSVPFSWAENMARTNQIWSYRTATHAAYQANPRVIEGWVWQAALDKRTCVSCVMQHGKFFTSDQILNDHHRGRCTPLPVVRGTTWRDSFQTGSDWLREQPVADQRDIFHNNRLYDAWRRGEIRDAQLSTPYDDPVYGQMLRVSSYVGIRGRGN